MKLSHRVISSADIFPAVIVEDITDNDPFIKAMWPEGVAAEGVEDACKEIEKKLVDGAILPFMPSGILYTLYLERVYQDATWFNPKDGMPYERTLEEWILIIENQLAKGKAASFVDKAEMLAAIVKITAVGLAALEQIQEDSRSSFGPHIGDLKDLNEAQRNKAEAALKMFHEAKSSGAKGNYGNWGRQS